MQREARDASAFLEAANVIHRARAATGLPRLYPRGTRRGGAWRSCSLYGLATKEGLSPGSAWRSTAPDPTTSMPRSASAASFAEELPARGRLDPRLYQRTEVSPANNSAMSSLVVPESKPIPANPRAPFGGGPLSDESPRCSFARDAAVIAGGPDGACRSCAHAGVFGVARTRTSLPGRPAS